MKIDIEWLRQFILSVVKPLRSGKTVDTDASNTNAGLDNLIRSGYAPKFRIASAFGMIAKLPASITAFYNSLEASGHENILIAQFHHDRPTVNNIGEVVFYSSDSSGGQIKTTITLTNDGKLVINCPSELQIICTNANINASTKAVVSSPLVEIGSGALEKILNGETFQTLFNTHTHSGNLGYPTSPPNTLSTAAELSQKVKAAK